VTVPLVESSYLHTTVPLAALFREPNDSTNWILLLAAAVLAAHAVLAAAYIWRRSPAATS
jgi:hypothetical protein